MKRPQTTASTQSFKIHRRQHRLNDCGRSEFYASGLQRRLSRRRLWCQKYFGARNWRRLNFRLGRYPRSSRLGLLSFCFRQRNKHECNTDDTIGSDLKPKLGRQRVGSSRRIEFCQSRALPSKSFSPERTAYFRIRSRTAPGKSLPGACCIRASYLRIPRSRWHNRSVSCRGRDAHSTSLRATCALRKYRPGRAEISRKADARL